MAALKYSGRVKNNITVCSLILSFSFIILLTSCVQKPDPYSIVQFRGNGGIINYTKSFMTVSFGSDSLTPNSIIAEDGDILMYGEEIFTSFSKSAGSELIFNTRKDFGYINGRISSISIPEKEAMMPWFFESDTVDFSQLRFISFRSVVPQSYFPFLMQLAEAKPDVGLIFENALPNKTAVLKIFDPSIILGTEGSVKDYPTLSAEPNLETLLISLDDSVNTVSLPAMPRLKQLIITGSEDESLAGETYFENNRQIEKLSVISLESFDCSVLKPLINLRELMIFSCDTVLNADLIKGQKKIEVLIPSWEDFRYEITAEDLPALRWIRFTSEVPQGVFDKFIGTNPELEVVEIIKNSEIANLASLFNLKKLYGLTIVDTLTDMSSVKALKNLKYLSLPENILSDSLKKSILRQEMPGTVLAANEGVCLGSGWLLLLIPFVFLFRMISRKRKS